MNGPTPLMGRLPSPAPSRTHNLNSQPVVAEVAESVCLPLEHLHLGVESFGDPVVPGKAPHHRDFKRPGGKGLDELGQTGFFQLMQSLEEAIDQRDAFFARAVLLQQQIAKPLFETVDFAQDRELVEVGLEFELLVGLEIVAVVTHQREAGRGAWRRWDRSRANRPGRDG